MRDYFGFLELINERRGEMGMMCDIGIVQQVVRQVVQQLSEKLSKFLVLDFCVVSLR